MVQRSPYDDAASRLGLMYRLPTDAGGPALVIARRSGGVDIGQAWRGQALQVGVDALEALPACPPGGFATIALPGTLDDCSAAELRRLLGRLTVLLAPAGTLVGHVQHGHALSAWRQRLAGGAAGPWRTPCTPRRLAASLQASGLQSPQVHWVLPSIHHPMALLPTRRDVARPHFLREVASARGQHGRAALWLRQGVAWAGLSGLLNDTLFFWARKPC
jgi:hypothetical protein